MRKVFAIIVLLLAVVLLLPGCDDDAADYEVTFYTNEENKAEYILENEQLQLKLYGATGYFTLTDKQTGQAWESNPAGAQDDAIADPLVKYAMMSSMVLTYVDKTGNEVIYDGYRYSVKEGTFQVFAEEDKLQVKYMVGLGEKFYICPQVISQERMNEYLEQMKAEHKAIVLRNYLKLDISKKKPEEAKELLEKIPALADGPMYALASATGGKAPARYQMEQLEEAFTSLGYTKEQAEADSVESDAGTDKILFNVTVCYRLDGDALVVEIPEEEMKYPEAYPICQLQVLPYFMSAGTQSQGYLVVPDGGGAQIDFNNGKTAQSAYYSSIYGWDDGYEREKRVQDPFAAFPVFGMAADGNYLLAIAEGGAAEMSVEADVSGKRSSYNYVKPIFNIVHGEDTSVSAKSAATVRVFQSDVPDEVLTLRYYSGGSESYVDMALRYREYLQKKYPSLTQIQDEGYPMLLELVGAIDHVEKVLGIPVRQTLTAVDYKEAAALVKDLSYAANLHVRYAAVLNGGADQKVLFNGKPVSQLGSNAQRKAFLQAISDAGAQLYIDGYVETVLNNSWFSANQNAIRSTTNVVAKRYPYWQERLVVTEDADDLIYLLNKDAITKAVGALAEEAADWNAGASFSDLGHLLYTDFTRKNPYSRDDMLRLQSKLLQQLHEEGKRLMVTGGNDYAAVMADFISDMDLSGDSFDIVDRQIPFYQIALHGLVGYAGEPLNCTGDYRRSLLKTVETGAGLSFRFAETDYQELKNNRYTYQDALFSSVYADWEAEVEALYTRLDRELGHTAQLQIKDHYYVTDYVTCTVYADGTRVYVNYGIQDAVAEGVKVAAEDWTVAKGE